MENSVETKGAGQNGLKLNIPRTILVGLAFFTITIFWQCYDALMPLYLTDFGFDEAQYGLIMIADNVLALFLLPFMGLLSDRFPMKWRNKFGRRIPFIVCGSVLAALTMLLLNLGHAMNNLPLMLCMTAFVLVFMCLYRTPAVALMPDVTPKKLRSPANAVINIMGLVGGLLFLVLSMFLRDPGIKDAADNVISSTGAGGFRTENWVLFGLIAFLMLLSTVIMVIKVKENKMVEEKMAQLKALGIEEDENEEVKKEKISTKAVLSTLSKPQIISLFLILSSVFLWYMAYNALTTHFSVFAQKVLSMKFELPLIVGQIAGAIMFIPATMLGKALGRKNTILIGVVLMFLGLVFGTVLLFSTKDVNLIKNSMYPVFILVGAGWATINVHSFVMSVELATEKTTGTFTGLYYTFAMAAQSITPFIAGLFMSRIDSRLLLPYSAIFMALAFVTMLFVKHGNVKNDTPAQGNGQDSDGGNTDEVAENSANADEIT